MKRETFPYNREGLTFDEKSHLYFYNEKKMLSTTSWIKRYEKPFNAIEISNKVSKDPNSRYYKMDPKKIRELWDKTAPRGTEKHNSIERWINGTNETCKEYLFFENLGINPNTSWSEIRLCTTNLYVAGTADIITKYDDEDCYKIWDIKTSTSYGKEKVEQWSKQILIYCMMLLQTSERKVKVKPGGIILIQPTTHISEGVNIDDSFNDPIIVDIMPSVSDSLKSMVTDRRKQVQNSQYYKYLWE